MITTVVRAYIPDPTNIEVRARFLDRLAQRTSRQFVVQYRSVDGAPYLEVDGPRIGAATIAKWTRILRSVV